MVPRKHQKLMVHIRKLTEREKKRKLSTQEDREQLPVSGSGVRVQVSLPVHTCVYVTDLLTLYLGPSAGAGRTKEEAGAEVRTYMYMSLSYLLLTSSLHLPLPPLPS